MVSIAGMFPDTFFLKGSSDSKRIALTFDDGPDTMYTPRVLDVLKEHDVPATFFLIGWRSQAHPDVVKRIMAEGHVVGNHSWSHPRLTEVLPQQLRNEITGTEDILAEITGRRTALMRPPYGAVSKEVLTEMRLLDYKVINWSVDSVDWRDRTVGQILANTFPDVQEEAIVLFHSAGGAGQSMAATVEALPYLIEMLREQGYTFVTVDELLGISAYR
jgi:peptidoglycan-N-acetylglucosamine deacetylase